MAKNSINFNLRVDGEKGLARLREGDLGEQAAYWMVQLASDEMTAEMHDELHAWREADARHEQAYQEARLLWGQLDDNADLLAESTGGAEEIAAIYNIRPTASRLRKPAWGWLVAAVLLVCVVGAAQIGFFGGTLKTERYETSTAEVRELRLADKSVITLGGQSSLSVRFTGETREVTLDGGEAFFDVAKDPNHPFIVLVGEQKIRVVGTSFAVRQGRSYINIDVKDGAVEVGSATDSLQQESRAVVLSAGQGVKAEDSQLSQVYAINSEDIASWRRGRFMYTNETLGEVVSDINRYYEGQIVLANEDLATIRVNTSFRADQTERALHNMAQALGLLVERTTPEQIVLRRQEGE